MKHFCLTLFFAYLLAACPNNCSGHGKCGDNGICECNKQTGLALNGGAFEVFTYTGADCSHRTCPLGKPFGTFQGTVKTDKEGYEGCNSAPCRRALSEKSYRFLAEETTTKATEAGTTAAATETTPEVTTVFPSLVNKTSDRVWNISNPIIPPGMESAGGTVMCRSSKTGKTAGKADIMSVKIENETALYATIRFMFELTEKPEEPTTANPTESTSAAATEGKTTAATEATTTVEATTTKEEGEVKAVKRLRVLEGDAAEAATTAATTTAEATTAEATTTSEAATTVTGEEATTTPSTTTTEPTTEPPTTAPPPPPPKEETFNLQELEYTIIQLRKDLTTLVPEKVEINKVIKNNELPTDGPTINGTAAKEGYSAIVWSGMKDILDDMGFFDEKPTTQPPSQTERMRVLIDLVYKNKEATFYCNEQIGEGKAEVKSYTTFVYTSDNNDVYFVFADQSDTPSKDAVCYLASDPKGVYVPIAETEVGKTILKCKSDNDCKGFTIPDTSEDIVTVSDNKDGSYTLRATAKTIGEKAMQAMLSAYTDNKNRYVFIPISQDDDNYGNILMKLTEGVKLSVTIFNDGKIINTVPATATVSSVIGETLNLPHYIVNGTDNITATAEPTTTATTEHDTRILGETLETNTINLPTVYTSVPFTPLVGYEDKVGYSTASISIELTESDSRKTMECSGQGLCNRETGQCECYAGYDGDACQRLSCPNDCSNHGRCVKVHESLENANVNLYKGFGNDEYIYSCICDAGHRGSDCSLLECPSSVDPMKATNDKDDKSSEQRDCSGRGNCDYSSGLCSCFDGFYGEACQNANTYA